MKVNLYGTAYHTYDYYFFTNESLETLFCNVKDLEKAISYIEGNFAIQIIYDDKEMWITDCWGMFPIFFNPKICEVRINFKPTDIDLILNQKYFSYIEYMYNKYNYTDDELMFGTNMFVTVEQYNKPKLQKKIKELSIINKDPYFNKYMITPFQNWFVLKHNTILTIFNNKTFQLKTYDIKNQVNILYEKDCDIFLNIIQKLLKNKKCLLALSYGYDSRCIYSILLKNGIIFDYWTFGKEAILYEQNFLIKENKYSPYMKIHSTQYIDIIDKYIFESSGFGDYYQRLPYIDIIDKYKNDYDIFIYGFGSNAWFELDENILSQYYYVTGAGHLLCKFWSKYVCFLMPYLNKRLYLNYHDKSYNGRMGFYKNIILQTNPDLLKYPCFSRGNIDQNQYSYYFDSRLSFINYYKQKWLEAIQYES